MSNSIDQRIVQMEFDNSSFERGVAKTMASLESLDKVLGGTKGYEALKNVASQIDTSAALSGVSGLSAAFDSVADRAESAFSRVTSAIGSIGKGVSVVTALINTGIAGIAMHGGLQRAMDLSDAKFKLDQLGQSWENVGDIIQESVNDTAYGLGEAAVAAAGLAASGVTAENGLAETLKATANLASVSGMEYSRVAQLMGQVASQGKLMHLQLESFSLAGINAAAMMANYWGVTEAEVHDMVKKGQIDLEMFVEAMNATLGEGAKKAQNTFKGSLSNVKAALSRSTADMFEAGMTSLVPMFNAWRECINQVNKALNPLMRTWKDAEGTLHEGVLIRGFRDVTAGIAAAFSEWANDSTGPENLARLIQELSDGLEGFFSAVAAGAKDFTYSILDVFAIVRELARLFGELISPIFMALNDVFGGSGFADAMAAVRGGLEGILQVLVNSQVGTGYINVMRTAFALLFTVVQTLGKAAMSILGGFIQVAVQIGTVAGRAFFALFEVLNGIGQAISEVFKADIGGFFDPIMEAVGNIPILSDFANVLSKIPEGLGLLISSIKGEDGVFDRLQEFMGGVDSAGAKLFEDLGVAFGHLGEKLSEFGAGFRNAALDVASKALERFRQIAEKLKPVLDSAKNAISNAWKTIVTAFQNSGFSFDPFVELFHSFGEAFSTFIDSLTQGDGFSFDSILKLFGGLKDGIGNFLKDVGEPILAFFSEIGGKIAENLGGPFEALYNWVTKIQDPLGAITSGLQGLFDSIGSATSSIRLPWASEDNLKGAATLSKAVDTGSEAVNKFGVLIEAVTHPLETAGKLVAEILKSLGNGINTFVDSLQAEGMEKALSALGKLAVLGGIAVTLKETADFLHSAEAFMDGIGKFAGSLAGIADSISSVAKGLSANLKVAVVTQIAVSIGILVGALYLLSKVDPERLIPSMTSLIVLIGLMAAIVLAMGKIKMENLLGIELMTGAMRSIAVSVAIMAGVAALLGHMDPGQLKQGEKAIAAMAGVLAALMLVAGLAKGLATAGTALLHMAVALGILVAISAYLTMNWQSVLPGAMMVLAMLGVLVLVAIALERLGGFKLSGTSSLVVMAAALAIIGVVVAALTMVASHDLPAAFAATGMVAFLLIELAAIAIIMDKFSTNEATFLAAATSLVVMSSALLIIVGAIAALAFVMTVVDVLPAFLMLAGVLIAMAAAMVLLGSVGGQAALGAAALVTMALALAAVAAIVVVLGTMPVDQVIIGMVAIAAAIAIFVGATVLLAVAAEAFALGMVIIIAFVLAIGASAMMLASAAQTFMNVFTELASTTPETIDSFIQGLSQLGQGLWSIRDDIALGIAGIGYGIVVGLASIGPSIAVAAGQLIISLAQGFLSAIPALAQAALMGVVVLISSIADGLHAYAPAIGEALLQLGVVIVEGLVMMLTEAFASILGMIDGVVEAVTGTSPNFAQAARDLGQAAVDGLDQTMSELPHEALDEVKASADAVLGGKGSMQSAGAQAGQGVTDGFRQGTAGAKGAVMENVGDIPNMVGALGGDAFSSLQGMMNGDIDTSNIMSSFQSMGIEIPGIGAEAGTGFTNELQESVAAVDISDTLMQDIDSGAVTERLSEAGVSAAEGFNSGFHDNLQIDGSAIDISSLSESGGFSDAATTCATAYTDSLTSGLSSVSSIASNAGQQAVNSLRSGGAGGYSAGYSVGSNMSFGVAAGLWAGYGSIAAAAASIIAKVNEVMEAKASIHSPSKMTMRIGRYLAEGVAVGMLNEEHHVANAAGGFMTAVLKSMTSDYVDALMGDIDENPTIRPVLDLEEYSAGINAMNSMMPTDQYMMAGRIMGYGNVASPFSSSTSNSALYNINLNYTNDADANKMFEDLTRELHSKNLMEAH